MNIHSPIFQAVPASMNRTVFLFDNAGIMAFGAFFWHENNTKPSFLTLIVLENIGKTNYLKIFKQTFTKFVMEKDIGRIKKNDTTDVVIRIDDFGGRTGLTIREYVSSEKYTGFTKAGVRILAENFPKFKEMIDSVSEADLKSAEPSAGAKTAQKKFQPEEEIEDY